MDGPDVGPLRFLKYASCRGAHPSVHIEEIPCVAVFAVDSSDVQILRDPHNADLKAVRDILSVKGLRVVDEDAFNEEPSPALHRLVLESVGRPLWEYTSDKELLVGFRAALNGHQFLSEKGILLHRNISACSVLLGYPGAGEGREGFITDVEFAHEPNVGLAEMQIDPRPPVPPKGARTSNEDPFECCQFMPGTLPFMAVDLLNAITTGVPIEYRVEHELESFIWVLGYRVARRLVKEHPSNDGLQREFQG
ncbi:hypothetical protein FA95DRAFT_330159 [Auriscalpium vulgare]|uniref:Uncharacterized protein n=1 Tax=Auriscalpium vulgare TaxID=40419 RepID=A0ACB8RK13_9AGAM|nr:hypothetical protein FA95DRAFT_330159 [Auriscalpium vulgare]